MTCLNTYVTKVLLLPLVPKGTPMEPRDHGTPRENHFPTGILQWNLHHLCTGHKNHNSAKKKINK